MNIPNTKTLKSKAPLLKPIVNIGKQGITDSLIKEITKQLKKRKLIKIKLLKSFSGDRKEAAQELVAKTKSELISQIGKAIVLYKGQLDSY